jgi:hypothetical protein
MTVEQTQAVATSTPTLTPILTPTPITTQTPAPPVAVPIQPKDELEQVPNFHDLPFYLLLVFGQVAVVKVFTSIPEGGIRFGDIGSVDRCSTSRNGNSSWSKDKNHCFFQEAGAVLRTSQSAELEGAYLANVQVHAKLGGGNFGDVYEGLWQDTTKVALKTLKMEQLEEFAKEYELLRYIENRFLAHTFQSSKTPKCRFFLGHIQGTGWNAIFCHRIVSFGESKVGCDANCLTFERDLIF